MNQVGSPLIIALDHETDTAALAFVKQLSPQQCRLKVGKHLFVRFGPDFVRRLVDWGFDVFLDLKFHDIPYTVRQACCAAAELGVWMLNVHCQGGTAMLEAAVAGVSDARCDQRPLLIGVTVLTSLNQDDMKALGYQEPVDQLVSRYAQVAVNAGLEGVVCSAQETRRLREHLPSSCVLVTPGIRLPDTEEHDQQRVQSPQQAFQDGSNYLVVGRPITQAQDPAARLEAYLEALIVP